MMAATFSSAEEWHQRSGRPPPTSMSTPIQRGNTRARDRDGQHDDPDYGAHQAEHDEDAEDRQRVPGGRSACRDGGIELTPLWQRKR
jgi:hypothetical protein